MSTKFSHRRDFLRFLAAGPFATSSISQDLPSVISRAKDALIVMDFEPLARQALPPCPLGLLGRRSG